MEPLALVLIAWMISVSGVASGQRWREEPGRMEFTGKMVVRPLQIEHWMERGFTREQAQVLYTQAVDLSDCRVSDLIEYTFPPLN